MRTLHLPTCSSVLSISCFIVQTTPRTTMKLYLGSKLKFGLNLILFGTGQYNLYVKTQLNSNISGNLARCAHSENIMAR